MAPKRLYKELKDYKKMKHRDVEISLEIERKDNKYRNNERDTRIDRKENYCKYSDSRYKDSYKNQSNEVFFFNKFPFILIIRENQEKEI